MQINAYLNFNGNCREALEFYEKCFGAKILMMQTHGDAAVQSPKTAEDWKEKILHARLQVGDSVVMASDSPPEYYAKQQGFYLSLQLNDLQKAAQIFAQLAENGRVHMPFAETFWAGGFGMLQDRFGIPWMVNCDLKE